MIYIYREICIYIYIYIYIDVYILYIHMYDLGELWKEFRKELSEELLKEFQNKSRTEAFQNEV